MTKKKQSDPLQADSRNEEHLKPGAAGQQTSQKIKQTTAGAKVPKQYRGPRQ